MTSMPSAGNTGFEGCGERGVAVADEDPEPGHAVREVQYQIPGLLGGRQPSGGR